MEPESWGRNDGGPLLLFSVSSETDGYGPNCQTYMDNTASSPYTSTSDINYIGLDGVTLGHKSYLSYATNISKWKYIWDVNNWGTILVHLHSGVCVWQSCLADQIFIIYVSHNWTIEMIPICLIERTIIDSQRKRTSASRVASLRIINGQNDLLWYSWEWY